MRYVGETKLGEMYLKFESDYKPALREYKTLSKIHGPFKSELERNKFLRDKYRERKLKRETNKEAKLASRFYPDMPDHS